MPIHSIEAKQGRDSLGNFTLEVEVTTEHGIFGGIVPFNLSDSADSLFYDKDVAKAVDDVVNKVAPFLIGQNGVDPANQAQVDALLEGMCDSATEEDKVSIGKASLAVSMAICRCGATKKGVALFRHLADLASIDRYVIPVPAMRMIIGSTLSSNQMAIKDLLIFPTGAKSFHEALKIGSETYGHLRELIKKSYGQGSSKTKSGDEGGFSPNLQTNEEGLELLKVAIENAGYTGKIEIGMDVAASEFFLNGMYDIDFKNPNSDPSKHMTADQLLEMYKGLVAKYPIVSIEDAYDQDAWDAWAKMKATMTNIQLVGSKPIRNNLDRLKFGIQKMACSCSMVNFGEYSTVSSIIEFVLKSRSAGWGCMFTQRSEDVEDAFFGDVIVGLGIGQLKTGAPCRSELRDKFGRLESIEKELGSEAIYAGRNFHNFWSKYVYDGEMQEEDDEKKLLREKINTQDMTFAALMSDMQTVLLKYSSVDESEEVPQAFFDTQVATGIYNHLPLPEAYKAMVDDWNGLDNQAKAPYKKNKKPRIC